MQSNTIKKEIVSILNEVKDLESLGRLSFMKTSEHVWKHQKKRKVYAVFTKNWPDSLVLSMANLYKAKEGIRVWYWTQDEGWRVKDAVYRGDFPEGKEKIS